MARAESVQQGVAKSLRTAEFTRDIWELPTSHRIAVET